MVREDKITISTFYTTFFIRANYSTSSICNYSSLQYFLVISIVNLEVKLFG